MTELCAVQIEDGNRNIPRSQSLAAFGSFPENQTFLKNTEQEDRKMAKKLEDIEGVGAAYAAKLEEAGVKSQEALLEVGGTPKGRKDLEAKTGISGKLLLKWINRADLARVKGVGEEYADLLELAGVDTVPELAQRSAVNLHKKLEEVAAAKPNTVRRVPSESEVEKWVAQAKELPRAVSY